MHNQHRSASPDVSEGDVNLSDARRIFQERAIGQPTTDLLHRDNAAYLHQSLSTPCLNALKSVRGATLTDLQGRELLDFHGNSVHQVGHGHPRVIEAIKRQLDTLPFCPRRYTNQPAVELAERLGALTGGLLPKVLLAPGGALAVSMALKLARMATGRFKFVSMWGAFHGATLDTISVGGEAVFRYGIGPLLPGCEHAPACAPSRCSLGCGGTCSLACVGALEDILSREKDVAAVISEPVRCTTVDLPPIEYWKRVRAACDRAGTLLILDEIPTCLGRTGRMFSYEHFGIVPDLLVIGKGLGGGIFPQAALLASAGLDIGQSTALGHFTHEKSPVGAAAALATLDVIRDENLVERAATVGESWCTQLRAALKRPGGIVKEVRGIGLLVGIELNTPAENVDRILYRCIENGLNFKVSDGRVLTLTPPLTVTDAELERATAILEEAITAVA